MSNIRQIISSARRSSNDRIALVIGNGIHRYNADRTGNDWSAMIHNLARLHGLHGSSALPNLALTELFDLIDLRLRDGASPQSLQIQFCAPMTQWTVARHHRQITRWARSNDSPILTTNFDRVLSDSVEANLFSMFQPRGGLKAPTDYYPWEKYYGFDETDDPCDKFGIWHINGLLEHVRSIRLGLTHYMGSVSRARGWLHGSGESRLLSGKDRFDWRGRNTWLHIVFNMPLLIFGLQLGAQEVFLRWLLIERAKYFRKFPDRRKKAWYVHTASENSADDQAKYFFLDSIGIEAIEVQDYDDIYDADYWRS
jgi:hypothetical protein